MEMLQMKLVLDPCKDESTIIQDTVQLGNLGGFRALLLLTRTWLQSWFVFVEFGEVSVLFVVWSGLGNRKIGTLLSIEDRRCLLVVRVGTWLELPLATTDTIRAKAKMQNIWSRKSLEKAKQIQPCCLTYYTTNQLGTSPTIFSTTKTFREHLKIVSNTKNQRGAPKT